MQRMQTWGHASRTSGVEENECGESGKGAGVVGRTVPYWWKIWLRKVASWKINEEKVSLTTRKQKQRWDVYFLLHKALCEKSVFVLFCSFRFAWIFSECTAFCMHARWNWMPCITRRIKRQQKETCGSSSFPKRIGWTRKEEKRKLQETRPVKTFAWLSAIWICCEASHLPSKRLPTLSERWTRWRYRPVLRKMERCPIYFAIKKYATRWKMAMKKF